jgi:hypothetical protein
LYLSFYFVIDFSCGTILGGATLQRRDNRSLLLASFLAAEVAAN